MQRAANRRGQAADGALVGNATRFTGSISDCTGSPATASRPIFNTAPSIALPNDDPSMRMNTADAVAMPRMLRVAAFCTETMNVVLVMPMPAPISVAAMQATAQIPAKHRQHEAAGHQQKPADDRGGAYTR